jgi:hypothetical protein
MQELTIDSKNLFYRKNLSMGTIEVVDAVSGKVLAVQNDYNENFKLGLYDKFIECTVDGQKVLFQPGIVAEKYKASVLSYVRPIADLIIQSVMEGHTLKEACKEMGVQYSTIMKWAKENQAFGENLDEARRLSSEMIHDQVMEEAREMLKGNMTKGDSNWHQPGRTKNY